ncbi:MAG: antibiotic biosynthesis monooxygenase [Xanthomonadales bacterium]|nr:antibiotic biosynthesis monooxygenase [Xanthomonadales bacterium]
MITRIVRMAFVPARVDDFLAHFGRIHELIRDYPGVQHLELHRDAGQPNVFYTYSKWDNAAALENYRRSDLFKGAWGEVKPWFSEKAQAFSLVEEAVSGSGG